MAAAPAALRAELLACFGRGVASPLDDEAFDALARRVFAWQFEANTPYRAYCERRGIGPDSLTSWRAIPAVPTAAFKTVRLVSGEPPEGVAARVFRTSGTSLGRERRGEHHVLDPSLYDASLEQTFAAYVLPDGARLRLLSLMPPTTQMPDSSLAYMITRLVERKGEEGSGFHASASSGINVRSLSSALRRAQEEQRPVGLLGTSLAFLHWLDALAEAGERFRLPAGSRVMDTGGYKGSRRRIPEHEIRARYDDWLGVPAEHCVNEYGMTELCSQCYDSALRDRVVGGTLGSGQRKAGPPWLRSRVVDPETLEPIPRGEKGILQHFDLANLGSVLAIQTEDVAREVEGGFVLEGRAADAPPRGCSIAMDLLLRAIARRGPR